MIFDLPDLIIFGLILLSILIGVVRGFIKELISLVTWVVAIGLAISFTEPLAVHMTFTKKEFIRSLTAFLLIFIGTAFLGALVNALIGNFVRKTPFSLMDRILGAIFGVFRGAVFITILVLIGGMTPLPEAPWWKKSYALSQFELVAIWLKERLPEDKELVFHFPREDAEKAKAKQHEKNIITEHAPVETLTIEE